MTRSDIGKRRRVVITGMGVVSPVGNNLAEMWQNVKTGRGGIGLLGEELRATLGINVAAVAKNLGPDALSRREAKFDARFINFAKITAKDAYADSGLADYDFDHRRFGVYFATSIGGTEKVMQAVERIQSHKKLSPYTLPALLPNMASSKIAIELGAKGSNMSIASACASGANAIGEAFLKIRDGYEDVMIAGASDALLDPFTIRGFIALGAIYTGANPLRASIPFDRERSGFVIGEGAGAMVLESLEQALVRKAHIYAELVGYGANNDAYNAVAPDSRNLECRYAITRALDDAGLAAPEIQHINSHGTSTILNDLTESRVLNAIFGGERPLVTATKSITGHLLGASGALEAIVTAKTVEDGIVPPTINVEEQDPACDINLVKDEARAAEIRHAISNSFGFGGHNACLVFKRWEGK